MGILGVGLSPALLPFLFDAGSTLIPLHHPARSPMASWSSISLSDSTTGKKRGGFFSPGATTKHGFTEHCSTLQTAPNEPRNEATDL